MEKRIFIKTFGCQMNEYDSNRIYDSVKKIGFNRTDDYTKADCYVLNTCHIRDKAKEKVFHEIGRLKKHFKNKIKPTVIVTGCVAQAENDEIIKREPYVDIVMGPQSYHKINEILKNFDIDKKKAQETEFDTLDKFLYFDKIENKDNKVSSFLTIQEGCDKFCHFCVVPYTRGPELSRSFDEILKEAEHLVKNGTKEIILLGQNVNAYCFKKKTKIYKLSDLIIELEKIRELKRIRYTTSHPIDMTDDLIDIYSSCKKIMPFVHLPIQSGSDRILKLMNRNHTTDHYYSIFKKLKQINSNIQFSSDFIIGYPGETEKDFKDTLNLINKIKFINSYSFIFSPRPGTVASKLENVKSETAKERLLEIQSVLFNYQLKFNENLIGKSIDVLVENHMKDDHKLFGRNIFLNPVIFNGETKEIGKIVKIKIKKVNQLTLFGDIVVKNKMRAA
jgi:tRNA-2-methylthio-N6-dimethylallyladenosine synthase|tara:strand:- start:851 stop:2191 length:1341 start_codon:yes stop_codon:yes gene_type:complete